MNRKWHQTMHSGINELFWLVEIKEKLESIKILRGRTKKSISAKSQQSFHKIHQPQSNSILGDLGNLNNSNIITHRLELFIGILPMWPTNKDRNIWTNIPYVDKPFLRLESVEHSQVQGRRKGDDNIQFRTCKPQDTHKVEKKKLIYGEVKVCGLKTREIIFTLHTGWKCVMTGGAECAHSACYNFGHDYAKLGIQFVLSYLIGFL